MSDLCDEKQIQSLVTTMGADESNSLIELDAVLAKFPKDPRLHFLKGSILVEKGKLIEAHHSFTAAVDIAPDFAIARFQLGFFQLTSGESNNALKTWARLDALADGHYLKTFTVGLRHLIRDEIQDCIDVLQDGIAANDENPPLNNDMRLIIEQVKPLLDKTDTAAGDEQEDEAMSATSFILNQHTTTKH